MTERGKRQDAGKLAGEPIPKPVVPHRSIRGYQDYGRIGITERGIIPTGFGAIVRGVPVNSETVRQETTFVVQLGRIRKGVEPENLPPEDVALGFKQADRFEVLEGEHKGPVLVVPISLDKKYFIYVRIPANVRPNEDTQVTLELIDRSGRIPHRATISASLIIGPGGFDLDPINLNNHGKELDIPHAQLFYEFETGQGRFSEHGTVVPKPRRKMEEKSITIESTKEAEYIDLLGKFTKLATALGLDELNQSTERQLSKYIKDDPDLRRFYEKTLRHAFELLLITGHDRMLIAIGILSKDAGEPEDIVYKTQETERVRFASTRREKKMGAVYTLINREQEATANNIGIYLDVWAKLFPAGPRQKIWRSRVADAGEDTAALALRSRVLRERIVKEIDKRAEEYSAEAQTSAINLGIPADEALREASLYFRIADNSVPARLAALEQIEAYADQKLIDTFSLNLELRNMLSADAQTTTNRTDVTFANASTESEKIRIARRLFKDVLELNDKLKVVYKRHLVEVFNEAGIGTNVDSVMEALGRYSLKEQIQLMIAGKIPTP